MIPRTLKGCIRKGKGSESEDIHFYLVHRLINPGQYAESWRTSLRKRALQVPHPHPRHTGVSPLALCSFPSIKPHSMFYVLHRQASWFSERGNVVAAVFPYICAGLVYIIHAVHEMQYLTDHIGSGIICTTTHNHHILNQTPGLPSSLLVWSTGQSQ